MPFAPLTPDMTSAASPLTPGQSAVALDPRTARVVAFFESISPASLGTLPTVYSEQARFKDQIGRAHV